MILAAALLVLLGLGLFVGGVLTDVTLLYWACVAACVVAGVFLVLARLRMGGAPAAPASRAPSSAPAPASAPAPVNRPPATAQLPAATGAPTAGPATAGGATPAGTDPAATTTPAPPSEPAPGVASAPHPAEPVPAEPVPAEPAAAEPVSSAGHAPRGVPGPVNMAGDPPVEEVEVTDLLLVVDLRDEVVVVDEHPRYHLAGCRWLRGRETIPLPMDEARTDGFTPCGWCEPDRTMAERERTRRAGR